MTKLVRGLAVAAILSGIAIMPLTASADDAQTVDATPVAAPAEQYISNLPEVLIAIGERTNPALFWIHRNDPAPQPQEEIITEGPIAVVDEE